MEAGEDSDMGRVEREVALGGEAGEARPRPGVQRQRIVADMGLGSRTMSLRPSSGKG